MAGIDYTTASVPFIHKRLSGGLNSTGSPNSLEDNESSDLQNVDFDKFGSIKKRLGYTQLNTTAFNSGAAWNGLIWFEKSNGNNYLIGTCGDKIAEATSLIQTATPFTDRTGGLTITAGNNNHTSLAIHLDTVLGTNGVDAPWTAAGGANASAMTVPTGLTTAKYVAVFSNYTILANVAVSGTSHKSRLYWSAIDSISSWGASDFRDVSKNDGQEITGLAVLGEALVIFKTRSIWLGFFTGDSDIPFIFRKSRSHVGCVAGQSIQEADNGLIFRSADGYYFFDGNYSFEMSHRVKVTLDTFAESRSEECVSAYFIEKNRYIASETLSGGSTHNRNMTFDTFNNAWSVYKGINANCFARVYSSGNERIYFGDYSGFLYRMEDGDNDNPSGVETAIDAYWYSKWFDYGDLLSKKAVPQVNIYYQYNTGSLTFAYSYDFETDDQYSQSFSMSAGGAVYGTAVYDTDVYTGVGGAVKPRHLTGRGRVIRFKFANSSVDETFTVDGFGAFPHLETNV
jgi:hypothetical protein